MDSEHRPQGQRHLLRSLSALFVAAISRAGKYPVATIIGVALTYASSRALALIPTDTPFLWYVRIGTGFSLGLLVLALLVTLGALRGAERPKPFPVLTQAIIYSATIGFFAAIPVAGLGVLAQESLSSAAINAWAMWWLNVSIVACGGLWAVSAGIDTPIAWTVFARHRFSLRRSLLVAHSTATQIGVNSARPRVAVLTVGTLFALIPYVSLLAIPLLSHLSLAAFESWFDGDPDAIQNDLR